MAALAWTWTCTLTGCSGGGGGGPEILLITNSNADWWDAVEKGMSDAAGEFKVRAEMRRNEGSPQGQVEKLREAISLPGVKAVAVSVIEADAPGVLDAMRELRKAGKVVITIDSDVIASEASARQAYIGTNNVKAGRTAGKAAAAVRPEGGRVATFVGTASAANARERKDGFFEGAGDKFRDVETFEDQGDHSRAASNVQNALTKYNDLDMLLGLWSYNAPAIAEEVGRSPEVRSRTSVVTFDLDEAAVAHLEGGHIDVTVCQNPYEIGFQAVKLLKAMLADDEATVKEVLPDGKARDTGVRVIVPSGDSPALKLKDDGEEVLTIEEMKSWLASKGLKSS
jgi:ribose transport system substrate-binding protein